MCRVTQLGPVAATAQDGRPDRSERSGAAGGSLLPVALPFGHSPGMSRAVVLALLGVSGRVRALVTT